MRRRQFLRIAGSGITLLPWLRQLAIAADGNAPSARIFGDSATADIRSLVASNSDEAIDLTEAVFRKCILEKVLAPTEPLEHKWVCPGGPYYKGQWIWDSTFVVDLLSILPGKKEIIRDIFQNYWDFQDRWNSKVPDYAQDMITVAIKNGINEHYDSVSGRGIGVRDYCMSCKLATMMLDGLTQKYEVKLRDKSRGQ